MTTEEYKILSDQIADMGEAINKSLDRYLETMDKMIDQSIKFNEMLLEIADAIGKR